MSHNNIKSIKTYAIYKRLKSYIKPYLLRLTVGIICGILHGGSTAGMILVLHFVLSGVSGDSIEFGSSINFLSTPPEGFTGDVGVYRIIIASLLLPIVALIQGLLLFIGRYYVEWTGAKVITDLRKDLFTHIHSLPIDFFAKSRVGGLITRLTSDIGLLMNLVTQTVADIIREPFTLIGCITAMFYLDAKLSFITLVILPLCLLPVIFLGKRIRSASRRGQESISDMLSVAQESIGNAIAVKAFQTEEKEIKNFNFSNFQAFKMSMRQLRARAFSEPILYLLGSISISIIVVYSYLNNLSLALLMAFFAATIQLYKPLKKLSQVHLRIQLAAPGAERIFSILDQNSDIIDSNNAKIIDKPIKNIVFRDVNFSYQNSFTLKNINISINAGQCIAFVGSSGSGKSTLVNLLPRFFDIDSGSIEINDNNINLYKINSLRSHIGIVTQQATLFNRTISENISYGSPNATTEEIVLAAKRANAHEFIKELDDGYNTLIGERASRLSVGMAQRISIARALLRNPPILILDEATSALDSESEYLVQTALDELMKDRTVLVIAHRLSTIKNADLIVVLDDGKIIEKGTHQELINLGNKYKYFYDIQFSK